jgi:cyclopropane fatty-acyl-phospholipid synthase-like methyltransferase
LRVAVSYACGVRVVLLIAAVACSSSRGPATQEDKPRSDGPSYEGRPIAETCSYLGADWLDRPEREQTEQPDKVLDMIGIQPGMTVADVGAGTGYFTTRIAKRVGPKGEVIATELQAEMLRILDRKVSEAGLTNVRLKRATEHQANLPERCCDVVLLVDVYHELTDPAGVMAGVRRALKETGRLVLVEYKGEDPSIAIKPEHKMTRAQILKELTALGFALVESREEMHDQRVVIFVRDDAPPRGAGGR